MKDLATRTGDGQRLQISQIIRLIAHNHCALRGAFLMLPQCFDHPRVLYCRLDGCRRDTKLPEPRTIVGNGDAGFCTAIGAHVAHTLNRLESRLRDLLRNLQQRARRIGACHGVAEQRLLLEVVGDVVGHLRRRHARREIVADGFEPLVNGEPGHLDICAWFQLDRDHGGAIARFAAGLLHPSHWLDRRFDGRRDIRLHQLGGDAGPAGEDLQSREFDSRTCGKRKPGKRDTASQQQREADGPDHGGAVGGPADHSASAASPVGTDRRARRRSCQCSVTE